jgi:outer membrane protein
MVKLPSPSQLSCVFILGTALPLAAQIMPKLVGDVGMAGYNTSPIARTEDKSSTLLPYVYAEMGNFYARVDTFGYKLAPVGAGHLELSARVSFEGYQSAIASIGRRARPKPIGLGTFQVTPVGAFILYGFHDPVSSGSLIDATYAAEIKMGDFHVYPQAGVERRDRKYVEALYGVSMAEGQRTGLSMYSPGYSRIPVAALAIEYPLVADLKMALQFRKKWLNRSIYESPLVDNKQQTLTFLALSKTFK